MSQLILNLILTSMAVAGAAVLWRNWLEDHKSWKTWIMSRLGGLHKAMTCGSCFTYWLALVATITLRPMEFWRPIASSELVTIPLTTLMHWMALAWLSVLLRFAYVALQELVNYQVHTLRNHDH